ncbi:hypothetical protein [Novosphingobium sp.]|uniref:hypothetical protein n=1 Tax=Novosphingobium sp. TaxID=1874826 RepID=UPI0038B8500D
MSAHAIASAPSAGPAGWQTILADLSLILFMVTAFALANAPDAPLQPDNPPAPAKSLPAQVRPATSASPQAEPVALWRDTPGAPPLAVWLAEQARDPRLRITIVVRHLARQRTEAFARADRLERAAGPRGAAARLVIEQGAADGASVTVGYDTDGPLADTSMPGRSPAGSSPADSSTAGFGRAPSAAGMLFAQ